ncbi:MAG: ABC transporter permease subunit [Actinomycetota bacterium]|nr:ABC transporter permease subunit [Actinomycetota bacterium]
MIHAFTIALYALRESLRRRVFVVVALLTTAFLFLYRLGAGKAFEETEDAFPPVGVEPDEFIGATLLGMAMFATLFLGTVLAVFLTLGAVRGDAERGLLQPLVVRPLGRTTFLLGRFAGAAAVCAVYVVLVFTAAVVLTGNAGGWWPDRLVAPAVELAAAVVLLVALSLLGSVFLSATTNGIAVFMLFGAGLVGGLLGQIGEAINSPTLLTVAERTSWALPFEALYQDGLQRLTLDARGLTRFAVELGPFGGGQTYGSWLPVWAALYLAGILTAAAWGFARSDL